MTGHAGDIFVVDDNPHNLSVLTAMLRDAGYHVRIANTGRRALAAVEAHPPELIMLDINMPDLDGYEVCRQLKAHPTTRDVPVIFLSALDDVRDKVTAFRAGGVDYVTKPFHTEEVLARLGNHLEIARLRRALEERNRELAAKNEELTRAWDNSRQIFAALSDALPGSTLDAKYRVDAKIGEGGFAVVYRARHIALEKDVAVKVLRPDLALPVDHQVERFRREGIAATRIHHPNAVAVFDAGVTDTGIAYLVMELLDGRSLFEEMREKGRLPLFRCAQILLPVCEALVEAHAAGIVHRDIKPSNIFLHTSGGREIVKVVDFGIAKPFETVEGGFNTTMGRLVGTPIYMSPERLLGHPYDGSADSYSVGVTLYEMLTGRDPFTAPSGGLGKLIMTCVTEEPASLAGEMLPRRVTELVIRALAKAPEHRPTMKELVAELRVWLAAEGDLEVAPPQAWPFDEPTIEMKKPS